MNPVGVSVTGAGPGAVAPEASVRLWLVRHGETEWSRVLRHTGWTDVPLTDRGREQAAALAEPLRGIAFAAVLCSPLGRARETLRLARPDLEAELLDDLRERNYGVAEGRSTEQLREQDPDWNSWTTPIEGAETIDEVGVRANRAIARAVACGRAAADGGSASEVRDVLLVAHGHLLRILAARWIGQPRGARLPPRPRRRRGLAARPRAGAAGAAALERRDRRGRRAADRLRPAAGGVVGRGGLSGPGVTGDGLPPQRW